MSAYEGASVSIVPVYNFRMPPPYSPLQRQVLSLYRRALRSVPPKPLASRANFRLLYRHAFRTRAAQVSKRDVGAIEYMLRQGRRWIEGLESGSVKAVGVGQEVRDWEMAQGKKGDYWTTKERIGEQEAEGEGEPRS